MFLCFALLTLLGLCPTLLALPALSALATSFSTIFLFFVAALIPASVIVPLSLRSTF
ncbi:hypothetical protein HOY80DRAFT_967956 [Tuber brumale]|nr:hypothetical protein HOY80DRAFT_967956 [Tuber brumale]